MSTAREPWRWVTPGAILATGWLLFFVYASPGYLSADSAWQLQQGRAGVYSDWHPPAMAALWGVLDRIVEGPFLMLVAQSGPFLGGAYGILTTVMRRRRAAVVACAILLFPPCLTTMAVIWKDSQMAGYLMAGTACLLSPRRWVQCAGLGLFALASAMRVNAPAAMLPLLVVAFPWRPDLRWYARAALALLVAAAIAGSAFAVNRALTDEQHHMWHHATAVHDIVGIVAHATPPIPDAELGELLAGTHLRTPTGVRVRMLASYTPTNYWNLLFGPEPTFDGWPTTDAQRERIAGAWRTLVREHPLAYARHRLKVSLAVLGWRDPTWGPIWDGFNPDGRAFWIHVGIEQRHSAWQAWWIDSLRAVEHSWLFRPYVYFLLALLALPLLVRFARDRLAFALLASGLACEASLFVGASTPDFRYSHWMICATVVAYVVVFARRYRAIPSETPRSRST